MKKLKCPNCGSVFTVDESDYADILNQVKTAEFNAEMDLAIIDKIPNYNCFTLNHD